MEFQFSIIVGVSGEWRSTVFSDDCTTGWLSTAQEAIDIGIEEPWAPTIEQDIDNNLPWGVSIEQDADYILPWGQSLEQDVDFVMPWEASIPLDVTNYTNFTKGDGEVDTSDDLKGPWDLPWRGSRSIVVIDNDITFTVDGQEVQLLEVTTSTDWNSYCWDFQAVVASRANANICRPGGQPSGEIQVKEGILTINEYSWDFFIEDIAENYEYGNGTYNISGRSPTVRIAPPYMAGETRTFDTQRTYPAMIQDELTNSLSGVWEDHTDISASSFGLDSYIIPADTYSVQNKTTMEVLTDLVSAHGGFIQTSRRDVAVANGNPSGELQFLRKYPEWTSEDYSGKTPDEYLNTGIILSQGLSYEAKPGYNKAVATPTEYKPAWGATYGKIVTCVRDNTAGDVAAPPVSDILLCGQHDFGVERCRSILDANGWDQTVYTMALPLPHKSDAAATPPVMLLPRDLVEVDDLFDTGWRGVVTSTTIHATIAQVTQTITVERKHT